MWMRAPSSVSSVRRKSSSRTPSPRRSVQSPPPGSTFPRSRGPSKWPLAIGAVTRVPCGTAPIFCTPATATCNVINKRESIRSPPFALRLNGRDLNSTLLGVPIARVREQGPESGGPETLGGLHGSVVARRRRGRRAPHQAGSPHRGGEAHRGAKVVLVLAPQVTRGVCPRHRGA